MTHYMESSREILTGVTVGERVAIYPQASARVSRRACRYGKRMHLM